MAWLDLFKLLSAWKCFCQGGRVVFNAAPAAAASAAPAKIAPCACAGGMSPAATAAPICALTTGRAPK